MIYLVNGAESDLYARWIDEMHVIRARAFKDRLNWDVIVQNGRERDSFDDCNPLYVLSVDQSNNVQGALRLLPTTGPNMLRDVFPQLLSRGEIVESSLIWESSRFVIDVERCASGVHSRRVVAELLCGAVEVGLRIGLEFFVSVFDARVKRILESAKYPAEIIGSPQRIGRVLSYAGLFDISEERWQAIANQGSLSGHVLAPNSEVSARAI